MGDGCRDRYEREKIERQRRDSGWYPNPNETEEEFEEAMNEIKLPPQKPNPPNEAAKWGDNM